MMLNTVVKTCDYITNLVDEILRDSVVVGNQDKPLSNKPQIKQI